MSGGLYIYGAVIAGAVAAPAAFAAVWFTFKKRRRALAGIGAALAVPYLLIIYAFLIEPKALVVRHVPVTSARWTGPPLRVGVISDLHVGGAHVPPSRVASVVARMNAEKPDMIVLLGDYVDGHVFMERRSLSERADIEDGLRELAHLSASEGVYAVIGNHDVLYHQEEVASVLAGAGARVLWNEGTPVRDGRLWIAGLGELSVHGADYPLAASNAPKEAPLIVAMHWPDSITDIDQRPLLTLAGHSHCNQMGISYLTRFIAASPVSKRYRCGLFNIDGKMLYISGGIGTSILPMRFLAPPEIAIVTLQAEGR